MQLQKSNDFLSTFSIYTSDLEKLALKWRFRDFLQNRRACSLTSIREVPKLHECVRMIAQNWRKVQFEELRNFDGPQLLL